MYKLITLLLISSLIFISAKIPTSTTVMQHSAKYPGVNNLTDTSITSIEINENKFPAKKLNEPQKINPSEEKYKKMGKLSLIFGASSFVVAMIPYLGVIAFPLSIGAIILGILSLKNLKKHNTAAIVGITLGFSFIVLVIIALMVLLSVLAVM